MIAAPGCHALCFSNSASIFVDLRISDPARRSNVDRLELALDLVFVAQAMCHNIELQRPDRAEDQVVVAERLEQLCRTLFAQLCQALSASALSRSGSFSTARRKISGAKFGIPEKRSCSPSLKLSPMLIVP